MSRTSASIATGWVDPRLTLNVLAGEPKACACGAATFVMLHHWQGGNPDEVQRSFWCSASLRPIDSCPREPSR